MGFRISWIGFDGKGKTSALEMVGLRDTGADEVNDAPFSGAEIPGGWFILFSHDFQFASRERFAQLSIDCRIIACQVHEGIMFSAAYGYERGKSRLGIGSQCATKHLRSVGLWIAAVVV